MDTELDSSKTSSKKAVHKTGEFLEEQIANAVTNSYDDKIVKTKFGEETVVPSKKEENLKQIKTSIIKMKHFKVSKLLNDSTLSKFVTRKSVVVTDLPSGQYSVNKNIRFKTLMLRSDLFDFTEAYIFIREIVNLLAAAANENEKAEKNVAFQNNTPCRSCISKNNSILIASSENIDIVMTMYNLLEYIQN